MNFYSVKNLTDLLAEKKISAVELTEEYFKRIERFDPKLNSFITVTKEIALAQAHLADTRRAKGGAEILTGVPIAHKDTLCTKGVKTSCGSKMLDNFIGPYDAHVVERCNAAGMVMLGKLNMDEFAMGSSNETSFYGPVKNPWDLDCIPGGSSGGSSAAVAAGLTPIATGTDTGGSIRQPAAMAGVTGLKPTYGRVSRFGLVAYASSLDQIGPMAQSAEDCALLMNIIAGVDARDSTAMDAPVPNYGAHLADSIAGLKIGVPKEFFNAQGLDGKVLETIWAALREYEKQGAVLVEISLPYTEYSLQSYYVIAPAECSSNLSRFDGVRYGYRCENPKDLNDLYMRSRAEGFGAEVKRRIMVGTYVLSSGYYEAYYRKAQQLRRLISNDFIEAFKQVDVIMSPTAPEIAFKIGEKSTDPVSMYLSDIYTLPVNLAGLPGISVPAGFVKNLPVGLQIIGPHFSEVKLLNVAHRYQMVTDWHKRHPDMGGV